MNQPIIFGSGSDDWSQLMSKLRSGEAKVAVFFREEQDGDEAHLLGTVYWIDPSLTACWNVGFPGVKTYDQGDYFNFHTLGVARDNITQRIQESLQAVQPDTGDA